MFLLPNHTRVALSRRFTTSNRGIASLRRPLICAASIALFSLAGVHEVSATNYTWDTTKTGAWGTAGNWLNNAVPASSMDTLVEFGGTGAASYTSTSTAISVGEVLLSSSATVSETLTLGSNKLTILTGGAVAAPASIKQNGSGAFVFNGTTGIQFNNSSSIGGTGSGTITFNCPLLRNSNAVNLTLNNTGGATIIFAAANTFGNDSTHGLVLNTNGTLDFQNAAAFGTNASNFTLTSGTLQSSTGTTLNTLAGGGIIAGNITFAGAGNWSLGSSAVSLTGTRTITANTGGTTGATIGGIVSGANFGITVGATSTGTLTLAGVNTFTGVTTLSAGTLAVATIGNGGVAGNLGQATNVAANLVFDGGTLRYTGATATSNRNFTVNANKTATIEVTNAATNLTLSGAATSASGASLTKAGAGTLTLNSANTFGGTTTVNAGGLTLGTAAANLNTGSFAFNGGTLKFTLDGVGNTASQITTTNATFTAAPTLAFSATGLSNGQVFTLLSSTNNIVDGGFLGSFGTTTIGRILLTPSATANSIIVTASGSAASLVWAGTVGGLGTGVTAAGDGATWNNMQAAAGANWNNGGNYDFFYDNDNVTFNDVGSPAHTVSLTTANAPGSVTINTASSYTFNGAGSIAGIGSLAVTGGTLNLGTVNTYSGGTTINAGTSIVTGIANALPSTGTVAVKGTLDLNGFGQTIGSLSDGAVSTGVVTNNAVGAATLTAGTASDSTFSGTIQNGTGTVGVTKVGAGTLTLSGTNTQTGVTTFTAGTLSVGTIGNGGVAGNLGQASNAAANLVFNGGTLQYTGATTSTDRAFTINAAKAATIDVSNSGTELTMSGSVPTTTGSLTKAGLGTLILSGANGFTGGVAINAGVVRVGSTGALNSTTPNAVTFGASAAAGTKLQLNGNTVTIGGLASNATPGSPVVENASATAATLTVNNASTNTFAGVIQDGAGGGALGFTKSGAGTLALTGANANTYTGATSLTAGILQLNKTAGVNALPGDVTITGSAILALLANEQIADTANIIFNGSNADALAGSTGTETFNNLTVNSTNGATGQILLKNGSTVAGTATLQSGVTGVGSSQTATINRVVMSGTAATSILRVAGNTGNSMLTIGSGGITASGGEIQVKISGTSSFDAVLNLGGDFTATGNVNFTNAGYAGANLNVIKLVGTRTFDIGTGFTTSVAPDISGTNASDGLIKAGGGTLTLTSAVAGTYTGATTINAGTLSVVSLADGGLTSGIGASSNAAENLVLNGGTLKYSGAAASTDRLFTLGANGGTLDASGATNAAVTFAGNGSGPANALAYAGSGARTLTLAGSSTGANTFAPIIADGTGGATSLTKSGSGNWVLTGQNNYSGATLINGGSLTTGVSSALPAATAVTVNTSGVLNLGGTNQAIASLAGDATGSVKNGTASTTSTFTVNPASGSSTFSGVISGTNGGSQGDVKLIKSGAGTLILAGANTHTGGTEISGGTLAAGADNSLPVLASGSGQNVTLSGGTLLLNGHNQSGYDGVTAATATNATLGNLTLSGNSTLDFTTGSNTPYYVAFDNFVFNSGTLIIAGWTGAANVASATEHLLFATGAFTNGGLDSITFTNIGGQNLGGKLIAFGGGYSELVPELAAVPEPTTILGGLALLGMVGYRERRRLAALRKQFLTN